MSYPGCKGGKCEDIEACRFACTCLYKSSAEEARERKLAVGLRPNITSQGRMSEIMEQVFEECHRLRDAGQMEYAGKDNPAFANFERVAADLNIPREKVLWIFAMKHRDGIASYLNGHKSQREDVRGRINDLITYLVLLRGMIDENDPSQKETV